MEGDPIGLSRHSGTRVFAWTRNPEMIGTRFRVRAFSAPRNDVVKLLLRRLSLRAGEPEQRIVVHGLDRRKVAVRDELRPRRRTNVIRNRIQGEINDLARVRRDVAGRAVPQIAMEYMHAAGLACRSDNATF